MKKLTLSLACAAGAMAIASFQANGSSTAPRHVMAEREGNACKALVQKMELSPAANTWRNRMRTWKCRDDLSPDTPETTALLRELNQ